MPFKGVARCGRCRANGNKFYAAGEMKMEIFIPNKAYPNNKRLRVTCPQGHKWISHSKSAYDYIRRIERGEA